MYRESDRRIFLLFTLSSALSIAAAFCSIITYHFFIPRIFYRDLGLMLLVISGMIKLQLYLQKLLIIERRVANILQPSQRKSSLGKSSATLGLVIYMIFFWATMISVLAGLVPVSGWEEYFPF